MSDEHETDDENSVPLEVFHMIGAPPEESSLRWTWTTLFIDLFAAFAAVLEGCAGFFNDQARSLAAKASLREALEDREIKLRVQRETRIQMKLNILEDIESLPETRE